MNLPAIITNLFDTAARRRDNLRTLEGKLAELRESYERAIEAGDDAEADKIAAKMLRAEVEARNARLAIETAERQATERSAEQDAVVHELRVREHAERLADYRAACIEYEAHFVKAIELFQRVEATGAVERAAARAAGVLHCQTSPRQVWGVAAMRLQQSTHAAGHTLTWPIERSASRHVITIAERFARTEPAAALQESE